MTFRYGTSRPVRCGAKRSTTRTAPPRGFVSDNNASVHPDVMTALTAANASHQPAYGANVVGLQAICDRWSASVCPKTKAAGLS